MKAQLGWLLLARGLGLCAALVLARVLGEGLGVAGLGRLGSALAVLLPAQLILDFGLDSVIGPAVARDRSAAGGWMQRARRLRQRLLLLVGPVLALSFWGLVPDGLRLLPWGLALGWARVEISTQRSVLKATGQGHVVAAQEGGAALLRLLGCAAILQFGGGVEGALGGLLLADIGQWWVARRRLPGSTAPAPAESRAALARVALGFAVSGVISAVFWKLDLWMLPRLAGSEEAGLYTAGGRALDALRAVPMALYGVLLPRLARRGQAAPSRRETGGDAPADPASPGKARPIASWMMLIGGAMTLMVLPLTMFSGELMSLIYGPAFVMAGPVARMQWWSALPFALSVAVCARLVVAGRGWDIAWVDLLGAIANASLNARWIPTLGALGAARATLVCEWLVLAGYVVMAARLGSRAGPAPPGDRPHC